MGHLLWFQSSNSDVIHNSLHFLHVILQSIKFLSQIVVFKIQEAKSRAEFREEEGDGERSLVVALRYTVDSQTGLDKRVKT